MFVLEVWKWDEMRQTDAPAVVKVVGRRGLVSSILDALEANFIAVRTSRLLENSEDDGVHAFLSVLEERRRD